MRQNWNKEGLKRHYERIVQDAKRHGFTDEELERPYLDKLSHQTKSGRIMRMISLAYYLGKLKGVSEVDEGLTPVTLRGGIEETGFKKESVEPSGCRYCQIEPGADGAILLNIDSCTSVQYRRELDGTYSLCDTDDDTELLKANFCLHCGRPL